jgi:hypothetical protein
MPDRLDQALAYARRGWPIFPVHTARAGQCSCGHPACDRVAKHPRTEHGLKDATTSTSAIVEWWTRWPEANIGLPTGGHFAVLDVDPKIGGDEALRALEATHGTLPPTWRCQTGGGGTHLYFAPVPGLRNSASLLGPGLDIRGDGGYLIAPGSTHASGRDYVWEIGFGPDDIELAPMPAWMRTALQQPRGTGEAAADEEWVRRFAGVGSGERNDIATRCAGYLAARGLPANLIAEILLGYGARCTPPIDRQEAATFRGIAERIWQKEADKRRTPDPVAPPLPATWGPFVLDAGRLAWTHAVGRGPERGLMTTVLANFDAWITLDETLDDGTGEFTHVFQVEGQVPPGEAHPGTLPRVAIPAGRFDRLEWVAEHWGVRAVVRAAPGVGRHQLALAIRTRTTPQLRHVYTHTGYIDGGSRPGERLYLTATGAVGQPGYQVDLGGDGNLRRYALPAPPGDPGAGIRASLALLDVAADDVMVPLLGAVWRAPLCCIAPCDYLLWLLGETGTRKSSLAAVVLNHYGDFPTKQALPLGWPWTRAALERAVHRLKDALTVIDDYAPAKIDPRELISTAQWLIRALGNTMGRGRLGRDLSERPPLPPRSLVISTGEAFPPGESIAARALILRMTKETVKLPELTVAQAPAQRTALAEGQASYVAWLGHQFGNGLVARCRAKFAEYRTKALRAAQHPRVPEIVASLALGWFHWLTFAQETRRLSASDAATYQERAWTTLLRVGEAQGALVESRQPVRMFLEILSTMLEQQRAVLLPLDLPPERVERQGFEILGWRDVDWILLIPRATYREVARYCRDTGELFAVPDDQLERLLIEHGIAERGMESEGRPREYCGGTRRRVLKLSRARIVDLIGPFEVPELPAPRSRPGREPGDESSTAF